MDFQDYIKTGKEKTKKKRAFEPKINIQKSISKKKTKKIVSEKKKVVNTKADKLQKILENVTEEQLDRMLEIISSPKPKKKKVVENKEQTGPTVEEVIGDKPPENPNMSEEANRAAWILEGIEDKTVNVSDIKVSTSGNQKINKKTGKEVSKRTNHANSLL